MSWLLALVGFSILIILHELGHFVAARAVGMRVERFVLFFPPVIAKKKIGETEYGIGAIPLGGYVKITGMSPNEEIPEEIKDRAYFRQPVWKRIVVIAAGPVVNIVLAFIIFFAFFAFIGVPQPTSNVGKLEKGSPAAAVLKPGDRILSVDGQKGNTTKLANVVNNRHKCAGEQRQGCLSETPVNVVVRRNGQNLTLALPAFFDAKATPKPRMRLGFAYVDKKKTVSPGEAVTTSFDQMWFITSRTATTLANLVDKKTREQISGPVGNYEVTRQVFTFDFARAIFILGLISFSLGIINLLPLLPLDGGHIFWAIIEKIRGKAISVAVMERASLVGFAVVGILFFIGLSNDIGRLTGPGFGVK